MPALLRALKHWNLDCQPSLGHIDSQELLVRRFPTIQCNHSNTERLRKLFHLYLRVLDAFISASSHVTTIQRSHLFAVRRDEVRKASPPQGVDTSPVADLSLCVGKIFMQLMAERLLTSLSFQMGAMVTITNTDLISSLLTAEFWLRQQLVGRNHRYGDFRRGLWTVQWTRYAEESPINLAFCRKRHPVGWVDHRLLYVKLPNQQHWSEDDNRGTLCYCARGHGDTMRRPQLLGADGWKTYQCLLYGYTQIPASYGHLC